MSTPCAIRARAVAIDKDDATGWFNLGVAFAQAGNLPEAATSFEKAATIEPSNDKYRSAAEHTRCQVVMMAGGDGSPEAMKRIDECARIVGGDEPPPFFKVGDGGAGDAGPAPAPGVPRRVPEVAQRSR